MFSFISENNEQQQQEDQQILTNQTDIQHQNSNEHYYGAQAIVEDTFNNFPLNSELLAQFADLAYVTTNNNVQYVVGNQEEEVPSNEHNLYIQDEHRTLLHSSMSPLLAAVNDITKRDAEFSELQEELATYNKPSFGSSEYLLVTDSPVLCRAKASLPSQYLQFGAIDAITGQPVVCAKVCVPQRTKFGPFEGAVEFISDLDLDVLNVQTPRYYPLLMIDDCHILKTANENSTNWMRYVRLAETFTQQNLTLCLENQQIFFVTMRAVLSNEELRVGYDDSYAARFLLPKLQVGSIENCFPEQFLQSVPDGFGNNVTAPTMAREYRNLRSPSKRQRRPAKVQEIAQNTQKSKKKTCKSRKVVFKCNLCAKHYGKAYKLELHKLSHTEQHTKKPLTCSVCQQKCATPTALAAHLHSHYNSRYTCVYCEQTYKYVRAFKLHVVAHQSENGSYECLLCNKHYSAYHLVRKHVRLFHSSQRYRCDKCDLVFQNINTLQRHKLTHASKKRFSCRQCSKTFRRSDHLQSHVQRLHRETKDRSDETPHTEAKHDLEEANKVEKEDEERFKVAQEPTDGSQYLKMSPVKLTNNMGSSSSNRRKQVPTKLKADDLNKHSEACKALTIPFLISEQALHEEFTKSDDFVIPIISDSTQNKPKENDVVCKIKVDQENEQLTMKNKQPSKETAVVVNSGQTFKCHLCSHGNFKRRGILVNHLTKMHPDANLKDIPSLSVPVIKPQLRFPCSYCSNTYMSNIKRKEHILKHHPGEPLPPSMRLSKNAAEAKAEIVGTFEAEIFKCHQCPRQYSNRSRLLTHYRKVHPLASVPLMAHCDDVPQKEKNDKGSAEKESQGTEGVLNGSQDYTVETQTCLIGSNFDSIDPKPLTATTETPPMQIQLEPSSDHQNLMLQSVMDLQSGPSEHQPSLNLQQPPSPENKLLKLSSAATLELSRFDFFNERAGPDDLNRLPALFEESPLVGMEDEKYTQRTIELQFFEKIGKL